jgi:hypothetical protein
MSPEVIIANCDPNGINTNHEGIIKNYLRFQPVNNVMRVTTMCTHNLLGSIPDDGFFNLLNPSGCSIPWGLLSI